MQKQEKVDLIIYRIREQGLEVFIPDSKEDESSLKTLQAELSSKELLQQSQLIELDPVKDASGAERKAIAVEADWHDLPSLRAMIYEDYRVAKEKAKQKLFNLVPDFEKGAFVTVKTVLKRVLPPEQYAYLKELKEVLVDKNQAKSI